MSIKNYCLALFLFLIVFFGVFNLSFEFRDASKKEVFSLLSTNATSEELMEAERQEKLVSTIAASFYFRP